MYLTPWYPSERDAMAGLFVQKHAESVRAQGVDVQVLSAFTWREFGHSIRLFSALKRSWGLPDVVQLNVIQKQGLLALWLKWRYGIPYVVVEHWSGYLPENGQFMRLPALKRRLFAMIARKANVLMGVSKRLLESMKACGVTNADCREINNVVDDFFYEPSAVSCQHSAFGIQHSDRKTLLHVSCFDERAKNVKGLLRAAKALSGKRQDWRLVLIGDGADYKEVRAYAQALDLPESLLEWTGEIPAQEVAERMHCADALVLSSRFETYGVVMAEAAVAGLPILSTPVGIAEEVGALIVPHEIAQNNPGRMAEFIEAVLWPSSKISHHRPQSEVSRFKAETIGLQLKHIYEQALNRTNE